MASTITGISTSVGHIAPMDTSKETVKVAPTATPRMVRMPSPSILLPRIGTPASEAIRQARIGPSSQGKGRPRR